MNEKVKELKNQTLDQYFSHTWTTMDYDDISLFAEKFANLIVSECITIADIRDAHEVVDEIIDIFGREK